MGLFDSLYAVLKCPVTDRDAEEEIQFKWAEPCVNRYHLGDQLEVGPYGNLWIPQDYACDQCSRYEKEDVGSKVVGMRVVELKWHNAFIHLNDGRFEEVLTEEEFRTRYVQSDQVVLPTGQSLFLQYFRYTERKPAYLKGLEVPL